MGSDPLSKAGPPVHICRLLPSILGMDSTACWLPAAHLAGGGRAGGERQETPRERRRVAGSAGLEVGGSMKVNGQWAEFQDL